MAASTQNLDQYFEKVNTLYEACLIIAKRARLINQARLAKKKEREMFEEVDILEPGELAEHEQASTQIQFDNLEEPEKPVITARREFLNGELEFYYEPPKRKK